MHLSGLFIYPVKSFRGVAVSSARVDALGLVGDRRFMVVDDAGDFLSQRTLPRMTQIHADLTEHELTIHADGAGAFSVPLVSPEGVATRSASIGERRGLIVDDCGPDVSAWLSSYLGANCHLVRIGRSYHRPVLERPSPARLAAGATILGGKIVSSDLVQLGDGFPILAIGEASLADLNERLASSGEKPVPMDRFRPNLVIAGSPPFAEDTWARMQIGEVGFRTGEPCGRCSVVTVNQLTGEGGVEPLRTLATYRRDPARPTNVNFGQNFIQESKSGTLRVGDTVSLS